MQYIIGGTKHDDAVVTKCIFKEPILSVALDNGEVHVLNVENEETMVLHGHASAVWALESDGGRIASGDSGESPEIRMWNLMQGGACTHVLKGHRATIRALQLLSDGNTLVSASKDGIIKVWSLEKSECIQELSAHEGAVRCLGVDQSRHLLVSGSSDRTVRVWDFKNGFNCERVLRGHVGTIFCLGVQSEKGIVASGGEKGMLMLWNIEDGSSTTVLQDDIPLDIFRHGHWSRRLVLLPLLLHTYLALPAAMLQETTLFQAARITKSRSGVRRKAQSL
ncbi:Vegetative incompatibility protein HET-E-1 [Beauveria bassiana]|nr:Vegetative incompatibility protein HET-E-1 [Beauveria bassiana]